MIPWKKIWTIWYLWPSTYDLSLQPGIKSLTAKCDFHFCKISMPEKTWIVNWIVRSEKHCKSSFSWFILRIKSFNTFALLYYYIFLVFFIFIEVIFLLKFSLFSFDITTGSPDNSWIEISHNFFKTSLVRTSSLLFSKTVKNCKGQIKPLKAFSYKVSLNCFRFIVFILLLELGYLYYFFLLVSNM